MEIVKKLRSLAESLLATLWDAGVKSPNVRVAPVDEDKFWVLSGLRRGKRVTMRYTAFGDEPTASWQRKLSALAERFAERLVDDGR